jgi:hypothetical protein
MTTPHPNRGSDIPLHLIDSRGAQLMHLPGQKYLLVKGRVGLGNRIHSLLTGILYARLTGRRLVVDWSDHTYSNDGSNVFHRLFFCPSAGEVDELPEAASVTPEMWRGHLRDSVDDLRQAYRHLSFARFTHESSVDLTNLDQAADIAVFWQFAQKVDTLRPHFRGEFEPLSQLSTRTILRMLLTEDVALHPRIRARVTELKASHLEGRTVGVHVRLSDRQVRVRAILDQLDVLLNRDPDLGIFAATDNSEVLAILERRYPGVITTPHWYPPPGQPAHSNPACPDRLESAIEALVDLYLLASCDYLVADTTTSFARIAGLLMAAPDGNIIDVKPKRRHHKLFAHETWRHYSLSDSRGAAILRMCGRAADFSKLSARAHLLFARAAPPRRRTDRRRSSSLARRLPLRGRTGVPRQP